MAASQDRRTWPTISIYQWHKHWCHHLCLSCLHISFWIILGQNWKALKGFNQLLVIFLHLPVELLPKQEHQMPTTCTWSQLLVDHVHTHTHTSWVSLVFLLEVSWITGRVLMVISSQTTALHTSVGVPSRSSEAPRPLTAPRCNRSRPWTPSSLSGL